ncbi:hypothetical protein ACFLVJ_03820 [Chloroflexota bacterium]
MAINYIVPLFAAIIYISLLLVIIINRVWQKQHKLFIMYLVAATLWSFSTFLLRSDYLIEYKLLLFRVVILASMWWLIQLYYFIRAYFNQPVNLWIRLGYASLAISFILAVVGYWPVSLTFNNGVITPYWGWYLILYVISLETFDSTPNDNLMTLIEVN